MDCCYLPDRDRRPCARSRMVTDDPDDLDAEICEPLDESSDLVVPPVQGKEPTALRISIVQSPVPHTFYHEHPVKLTLNTGATSNMIRASSAKQYGFLITPASQMARRADGVTPVDVIGKVHYSLTRGQLTFELEALVVRQLEVDILAGNPFIVRNDIGVRPAKRQIKIGGTEIISYSSPSRHTRQSNVRHAQSYLLRNPNRTVILPGEYVQFSTPPDSDSHTLWALDPRLDSLSSMPRKPEEAWPPPQQIQSVDHAVSVPNMTGSRILLKSGKQLCQPRQILPVESSTSPPHTCGAVSPSPVTRKPFSPRVILDPDGCLDQYTRDKFIALNLEFDDVFNTSISKYNGASGKIEAVVNIGPTLPPQRKGRLPQYYRNTLEELQNKFDDLEAAGVFAKPEQVNVHVEYLKTSLLEKPNGGSRLVTYVGEVAQYSKPQPSLMPNVDGVLCEQNRRSSAKSKARGRTNLPSAAVPVGDSVFFKDDRDKSKAPEKYLAVNIREDLSCELLKFTTSQFCGKLYLVPMSECYPVAPTILAKSPYGPICGLHKTIPYDSDDDSDPVVLPPRHSTVHTPSLVVPQPPAYEQPTVQQPVYDIVPVQVTVSAQELPPVPAAHVPSTCSPAPSPDFSAPSDTPPESAAVAPRRSCRQRSAPFWQNQDWDLK
ncbi:hypothetical protein AWC38_SpisGene17717 [Stylophora pistillata]|uniref:Uncharacterized protein n=1 Tax=Stylophora pistillata TaxID=50429 RepID=A0A2B4RM98_STYPI|nr:hypothetical protein AWC38_SpisGene17717 [Stylophora pistillata]